MSLLKALLAVEESNKFIERFNERKDDLLELRDNFHDLENFYEHQRATCGRSCGRHPAGSGSTNWNWNETRRPVRPAENGRDPVGY